MERLTTIALLMSGDELMSGDIVDSNAAMIAQQLTPLGISVAEKVTLGDNCSQLSQHILRLSQSYPVLIINGGLGPTEDDLTAQAMAQAFKLPLEQHAGAYQHLLTWCQKRNLNLNKANTKQAILPKGCHIFADAPGSACAFYLDNGALVIATPGVPSELRTILSHDILPLLQTRFKLINDRPLLRWQTFGLGESSLQQVLDDEYAELRQYYRIGFRASMPLLEVKLQALEHSDAAQAQPVLQRFLESISDEIISDDGHNLAQRLCHLLRQRHATIGFAESCSGGLLASAITENAGVSDVFQGSVVSYSNSVKQQVLGVSTDVLQQHGAVSEACANAMLAGAFTQLHCDYAAAVTGIAGPTGGSEDKPLGTVYLAFGSKLQQRCIKLCIRGSRKRFQQLLCAIAFDLLRRQLLGLSLEPRYLQRYRH